MQKQRLNPKNKFKLIYKGKNRLRIRYFSTFYGFDVVSFEKDMAVLLGVDNVRVNVITTDIIIQSKQEINEKDVIDKLQKIELKKIGKKRQEINKTEIYLAASSFLLSLISASSSITSVASILSSLPLLKEGIREFFNCGLNSKTLEAMAVAVSLYRKDYIAANGTNLMLAVGEYMEESTVHKSDDLIKELARPIVKDVWIEVINGEKLELIKIASKDIKVGDIVVVSTGETIAIDGYIVDGSASINQVSMTGEAQAIRKERGDRVMSGTIVEEGRIKIWAELTGDDTSTEKIKKYIQNSLNEKSSISLKATKLADKLVPITFTLATLSYIINKNMTSVASVLQADYSCALKLATPVAFKSGISKAGKNGILVKGAKSIEALAKADTFVFDKTGTLTYGTLKVVEVVSFNKNWNKETILNLAASAEEHYFHPIAEAIVNAAKQKGFRHIHHDEVEFIVAHGLKTHFDKKEVIIGSRHFLEDDEKISFKKYENRIKKVLDLGYTLLYIAYDKQILGIIIMNDRIRENAAFTIASLKKLGVKEIVMLTGDIQSKADSVASELGIDKVYANMLPTDKSAVIEKLRSQGKNVVFCGDGINDAPSFVKANVGISMQKGADIAKATADIGLLKDDIFAVVQAKQIANDTLKLINRNFKATVGINSAILLGATLGKLSPLLTAFLHNGTTIGLLLNSIKGVNPCSENNFKR